MHAGIAQSRKNIAIELKDSAVEVTIASKPQLAENAKKAGRYVLVDRLHLQTSYVGFRVICRHCCDTVLEASGLYQRLFGASKTPGGEPYRIAARNETAALHGLRLEQEYQN